MVAALWQDIRYGVRTFRRSKGLTTVIVAIVAIGIGASTALVSLIEGCLLRSNTYPVVDRWDVIRGRITSQNANLFFLFSVPELLAFQRLDDVFEEVGALRNGSRILTTGDYPERVPCEAITANIIPMTGVRPLLGRTFRADEDRPGAPLVAVMSYEMWTHRFHADPAIIGKSVALDNQFHTVIGVMPPHYGLWGGAFWVPVQLDTADSDRAARHLWMIGVRRRGVTPEQANARLATVAREFVRDYAASNPEYAGLELEVWNINEAVIGGVKPALFVLLGAVALLLAIACSNVATLLLARSTTRRREMAIRMALGARRWQLIRQQVVEILLMTSLGGALGVVLATWLLPLLVRLVPANYLPTDPELIFVDTAALLIAVGLTTFSGVACGAVPAWLATRAMSPEALKEGTRSAASDRVSGRTRSLLIVAEVALTFAVVSGAALMIDSYRRLEGLDLGFKPDQALTFGLALPDTKYPDGPKIGAFYDRLLTELGQLPGIDAVAAVSGLPMGDRVVDVTSQDLTLEGQPMADARDVPNANFRIVSPDYFHAMGIPLRRGRWFAMSDDTNAPPVAVINETMAHRFWPDRDPIGRRMRLGRQYQVRGTTAAEGQVVTIIGIVADTKQQRDITTPVRQEFYVPQRQHAAQSRAMTIVLRSALPPATLTTAIRGALARVDNAQPLSAIRPMTDTVADSFGPKRLTMWLLGFFGAVSLLLALVGLHGVIAYSVRQRTQEFGIRLAIGARPVDIARLVLRQGLALVAAGVLLGVFAAVASAQVLASQLYQISATDPIILALVALILIGSGALACSLPLRHATAVDPLLALRGE
jgi:putative ABC transport system permease protein